MPIYDKICPAYAGHMPLLAYATNGIFLTWHIRFPVMGICQAYASKGVGFQIRKPIPLLAYAWHMPVMGGPPKPPDTGSEVRPNSIWHMPGICQIGIAFGFRCAEHRFCVLAYARHMPITGGGGPDDQISAPTWSKCAGIFLAYARTPPLPPLVVADMTGICLAYASLDIFSIFSTGICQAYAR